MFGQVLSDVDSFGKEGNTGKLNYLQRSEFLFGILTKFRIENYYNTFYIDHYVTPIYKETPTYINFNLIYYSWFIGWFDRRNVVRIGCC